MTSVTIPEETSDQPSVREDMQFFEAEQAYIPGPAGNASPLPTHRYTPDESESPSSAIITALSEAKGRDIKVGFPTHDAIVILRANGDISIQVEDPNHG